MALFCVWKDKDTLQALRQRPLEGMQWQSRVTGADAILLQAGQTPPKTVLRAAVAPEGMGFSARELVTYGVGPRSTVTLSSVRENELLLCLQREIVNLRGERLEQQELRLPRTGESERVLALSAALLLAGVEVTELADTLERMI